MTKDPLDAAVQKLDRGDTDGAISDLEDLQNHDSRPLVTETLASAYAARAGIRVDTYWGFLVGFRAPLVNTTLVDSTDSVSQVQKIFTQLHNDLVLRDDGTSLNQLARFFGSLELWQQRLNDLPTVSGADLDDVQHAIDILHNHPTRGGRLYRALLGLVEVKSNLDQGFNGWADVSNHLKSFDVRHPESDANKKLLCYKGVQNFTAWADVMVHRLMDTAGDIAVAYPSKSEEIADAVNSTQAFSEALKRVKSGPCL